VIGATIQAQVVSFPPNGIDCEQLNVDITLFEQEKKEEEHFKEQNAISSKCFIFQKVLPFVKDLQRKNFI